MQIKGRDVEILSGSSVVYFSGGEDGKDYEIGNYCFWTAKGTDEFGEWSIVCRALVDLPTLDRFQRMDQERLMSPDGKDRIEYQMCWDRMDTIETIGPSTMREICRWFASHKKEAEYAGVYALINGEKQIIPRRNV